MRKILTTAAGLAGTAALALTCGAATSQPAVASGTQLAATTRTTVMYGTNYLRPWSKPQVRPGAIYIGLGNVIRVVGVRWQHWHHYTAKGTGTLMINDCTPSCARGHYRRYHVWSLDLYRVRHHGNQPYYTRLGIHSRGHRTLTRVLGGTGPG